ncbi:oligosaccharide flippase family protein [Vibrio sp. TRT 17S01]|uniref:oligosaccharide flippase family protein n=1 Tax=Vibrio sp. TRT 17S01 TaxID=3418505 RepID=UPI003CE7A6F9
MFKKIGLTFFASAYTAATQILILVASARFLTAEELGWVSIGGMVLALSNIFIDSGLGTFIIYKRDLRREALNTLLLASIALSTISYGIVVTFSNSIEVFFESKGLAPVLEEYALILLLTPFLSQLQALLVLRQRLSQLAIVDIISRTLAVVVTIAGLYYNYGPIAIIAGLITSYLLKIILSQIALPKDLKVKPSSLDFTVMPEAWNYCKFQVGSQILSYIRTYIDSLIVGKSFDVSQLGTYSLAKDLVGKVPMVLTPIYSKLLLPIMSKVKDNPSTRFELFSGANRIVLFVNALVYTVILFSSDWVVNLLYGQNDFVADAIKILAVFYMIRSCGLVNGIYLQSVGRVGKDFYWNMFAVVVFPISMYAFSQFGVLEMLIGMATTQGIFFILSFIYFHKGDYPLTPMKYTLESTSVFSVGIASLVILSILELRLGFLMSIPLSLISSLLLIFILIQLFGGKQGITRFALIYKGNQ